jgi:rhodanese-related sulfurtransferase
MNISYKSILSSGIVAALSLIQIQAASPDGNWLWITPGRTNVPAKENILSLKADGTVLTGKISAPGPDGQPADTAISNGKVDGDTITFAVVRQANGNTVSNIYSAKVSAEKLTGTISFTRNGESRSREWEAKNNGARSVAASVPAPKPGYNEQGYKIVNETKYKELSVADAEKYLADHPDTIILDLRPPASYKAGHLPNARNLDVTDDEHYKEFLKPLDKTKRYLVHSVTGHYRTVRTFEYFEANGFENAVAIEGGYQAWVAAGKPVVK